MNNKIITGIAVVIAIAAGIYLMSGSNNSSEVISETLMADPDNVNSESATKVYKNDQYGFEFTYPADWEVPQTERPIIYTFKTRDGHAGELMLDQFGPMGFADAWKTPNMIQIGQEQGYVDRGYHCGDGTPGQTCTGVVIYRTAEMFARGFDLEFHIEGVNPQMVNGGSGDPITLFAEDIAALDKIVSTFHFTK